MSALVYLNGKWCAPKEAMVNVGDRGFLFGDAVYEAAPAYSGRFLRLDLHMARLRRGLTALRIGADVDAIERLHGEILELNQLEEVAWSMVYTQITRGVAPRSHAFPDPDVAPTVYLFAKSLTKPSLQRWLQGYAAVTFADLRWRRADLKTTMLLGNVLAQQAAVDAGVDDVIMISDGMALEGSHANLFVVQDGVLFTPALDRRVLPGVTRVIVIELAERLGLQVVEEAVSETALRQADEVFLCGTTTEIRPLITLDNQPVGNGQVGRVTAQLYEAFQQMLEES
ncbi:MAG: aminotransferase class IV [Pseudomonadota bacterium]